MNCIYLNTIILGVIVPDAVTGEPVFATQLDEDSYPGMNNNSSRAGRQGTRGTRGEKLS